MNSLPRKKQLENKVAAQAHFLDVDKQAKKILAPYDFFFLSQLFSSPTSTYLVPPRTVLKTYILQAHTIETLISL